MAFDTVRSDTFSVADGEWHQVVEMVGEEKITAGRIIIETDSGEVHLGSDGQGGIVIERFQ